MNMSKISRSRTGWAMVALGLGVISLLGLNDKVCI